jgi:hypothetical protein
MATKAVFIFSALGCLVVAATNAYSGPITYSLTKGYMFTNNQNVIPTLNETRYGHAFDFNVINKSGVASNTGGQKPAYDPFAIDSYNKNFLPPSNDKVYNWAIFNRPNGLAPVPIVTDKINGLTVAGSPYNNSTNAGGASANVNATVTALATKRATGTLTSVRINSRPGTAGATILDRLRTVECKRQWYEFERGDYRCRWHEDR